MDSWINIRKKGRVENIMYLSNCGQYIAISHGNHFGLNYDIIAVDGSCIWLSGRYEPTGFDDTDPRYIFPEFPHMVIGYHNYGWENRAGRWISDFKLSFADIDTTKRVVPGDGNAILKRYSARFKKQIKQLAWKYKA